MNSYQNATKCSIYFPSFSVYTKRKKKNANQCRNVNNERIDSDISSSCCCVVHTFDHHRGTRINYIHRILILSAFSRLTPLWFSFKFQFPFELIRESSFAFLLPTETNPYNNWYHFGISFSFFLSICSLNWKVVSITECKRNCMFI